MLAFFGRVCYHTQAVERRKQNPGVAKFGIALEWGSRGRWFESSHSDQIMGSSFGNFPLFLFCADSNPSKCDMPVAYCCHQFKSWWLPLFSPLRGENEIRIRHSDHKDRKSISSSGLYFFAVSKSSQRQTVFYRKSDIEFVEQSGMVENMLCQVEYLFHQIL